MAVFGILALLVWRALATATRIPRPAIWAIALTVLYAITDELHQGAVSGRHASPVDVGIDAAGAIVAVAVIGLLHRRRSPR
jgi:VanZ family protein